MYCPQCGAEYREGFTECSDCHVALGSGPRPEPPGEFDPGLNLVELVKTEDAVQLAMLKGLLEDAGIPYFLGGAITTLVNDVDPFLQKHLRVKVPADREDEARELLEMLLHPDPNAPLADSDSAGERGGGF